MLGNRFDQISYEKCCVRCRAIFLITHSILTDATDSQREEAKPYALRKRNICYRCSGKLPKLQFTDPADVPDFVGS